MIMDRYPVKDGLGIHLRTWGGGVSLVHARECETIHKHNPLKLLWACRMNYDHLQAIVYRVYNKYKINNFYQRIDEVELDDM